MPDISELSMINETQYRILHELIQSPQNMIELPMPPADISRTEGSLYVKQLPGKPGVFVSKKDEPLYDYCPANEEQKLCLDRLAEAFQLSDVVDLYKPVNAHTLAHLNLPETVENSPLIHIVEALRDEYMCSRYAIALEERANTIISAGPECLQRHDPSKLLVVHRVGLQNGARYCGKFGSRHYMSLYTDIDRFTGDDLSLNTPRNQRELSHVIHELIHQAHHERVQDAWYPRPAKEIYGDVNFDALTDPDEILEQAFAQENLWAKANPDVPVKGPLTEAIMEAIAFIGTEYLRGVTAGNINGGETYSWQARVIVNGLRTGYGRARYVELLNKLMELDLHAARRIEQECPGDLERILENPESIFDLVK